MDPKQKLKDEFALRRSGGNFEFNDLMVQLSMRLKSSNPHQGKYLNEQDTRDIVIWAADIFDVNSQSAQQWSHADLVRQIQHNAAHYGIGFTPPQQPGAPESALR